MSEEKKLYKIERTSQEKGYLEEEVDQEKALSILNSELENGRMVFIDGHPFDGEVILAEDLSKYKKSICITNRLIGG